MSEKKKILLSGASGSIGMEMLKQLKKNDAINNYSVLVRASKLNRKKMNEYDDQITVHYADITNLQSVREAVKGHDVIIHLAALIPTRENTNSDLIHRVNVGGTENIVRAMELECPDAFLIYTSSVAVYGDRLKSPMIKVGDPLDGAVHDFYAKTKIEAETIVIKSKLKWSIFRLSAIMGIGNHKVSGMIFEVPLETSLEIATLRDTANALIIAADKTVYLNQKIFNLSGGKQCRIIYRDFMERAFDAYGLGKIKFHKFAFALQNFHCGFFDDADILEQILHFQTDTIDTYFAQFKASIPAYQRLITRPFASLIKLYLTTLSKPLNAYRNGDIKRMKFYFG